MKLPRRLPYAFLIISSLLVASCGQNATRRFTEGDYNRLEVADANSRNAIARIAELESRVEELERRLH